MGRRASLLGRPTRRVGVHHTRGSLPLSHLGEATKVPETTSATNSLWLATAPTTHYPRLDRDVETDVAVVGGGIAGLTAALLLKQSGLRVAVLEARRVASGVTGCTTAKVSALQ